MTRVYLQNETCIHFYTPGVMFQGRGARVCSCVVSQSTLYPVKRDTFLCDRDVGYVAWHGQVRFILAVVENRLKVNNRKKVDLLNELKREGYDMFFPV